MLTMPFTVLKMKEGTGWLLASGANRLSKVVYTIVVEESSH